MLFRRSLSLLFFLFPLSSQAIYGELDSVYRHFDQKIDGRDESRPQFQLSVQGGGDLGEHWRYKWNPIALFDPQSKVQVQKNFFDIYEAYIEYSKDVFSLKLGWLQQNWGVTEGFDPTAVLHSYRIWDPMDMKRLASLAALAQWGWSSSLFEILVVPKRRRSMLPQQGSRWLPEGYLQTEQVVDDFLFVLPERLNYSYADSIELNRARDWNLGLRYYHQLDELDASVFFYDGAAPVPFTQIGLVVDSIGTVNGRDAYFLNSQVTLTPIEYRQQTLGTTLVYNVAGFILRFAGSYQNTMGDFLALNDWQHSQVYALERTFLGGRLTGLFEYSTVKREGGLNSTVSSISRLFDDTYLLALRGEINEQWSFLASYLRQNIERDQVYRISINGKLSDDWGVDLGWLSLAEDNPDTALASYSKNDQYWLKVQLYF